MYRCAAGKLGIVDIYWYENTNTKNTNDYSGFRSWDIRILQRWKQTILKTNNYGI